MEREEGFLDRQKREWKAHVFRKPSRRWWGLAGLVISLVMIYCGLASGAEDPGGGLAAFPLFGVFEGMGTLFGSLAEILPEEQTSLAGILRLWAGLFLVCGFGLVVLAGVTGLGPRP